MECEKAFNKAKTIWFSSLDKEGAKKAGELLSRIHPSSKCIDDANKLISEIDEKLKEDEKKEWEFMIRQYEDNLAREQELLEMRKKQNARNFQLQQQRINTYREIATEYAKNQPKSVTKNIYWR
jgi:Na+/phosphate symporter